MNGTQRRVFADLQEATDALRKENAQRRENNWKLAQHIISEGDTVRVTSAVPPWVGMVEEVVDATTFIVNGQKVSGVQKL